MAYKPPSRTDTTLPVDLETAFAGADTALRSLARSSVGLEKSRAGARTREAARIAAKYGADHPRTQAAASAAELQRGHLVDATRLAGRADVAPVDVGATGVAITGRVLDASGVGVPALTVQAADPRGRVLASSRTGGNGQFRLIGSNDYIAAGKIVSETGTVLLNARKDAAGQPAAAPPPASQPGVTDTGGKDAGTGTIGGNQAIVLVVLDAKTELYRDAQPFTVNPGLVLYREITVKR